MLITIVRCSMVLGASLFVQPLLLRLHPNRMPNHNKEKDAERLVDDSQSPQNEAQQTPSGSGDPRTNNFAQNVPLPFGGPTDNLHPTTQPQGDVTQTNAEVGAPSLRNQQITQEANQMRNETPEREYQGDTGRSDEQDLPGRMQDHTSVRPKDVRPDLERGYGSQHHGDEFAATEVDQREPEDEAEDAA
jgi:hypothetical protein